MDIVLDLHLEAVDGGVSWWAESEELPGVSAAAESLPELRELFAEIVNDLAAERGVEISVVRERLVRDDELLSADESDIDLTGTMDTDESDDPGEFSGDLVLTGPSVNLNQVFA